MQSMDLIAIQIVMFVLMASVYKMFNYLLEPPDMDLQAMAAEEPVSGISVSHEILPTLQPQDTTIQVYC
jgi:hypothetical protein